MSRVVYLIRHSEKISNPIYLKNTDDMQLLNEKRGLSIEGEKRAKALSLKEYLSNVDFLVSSNYTRSIATAKYIAEENNIPINIIEDFGERKVGINSLSELPKDYEYHQLEDENYKIKNGESKKEVKERMVNSLKYVLDNNKGKKIVIISHATAIMFLISNWCDVKFDGSKAVMIYNNKEIFHNGFRMPEVFKLEFDDENNLTNIENIREMEK